MTKTILLADDSVMIQKVIELTFIGEDFEVESVSSGDEALGRLESSEPNVVIADVHMHGSASGYAVARRSKELYAKVPVLLLVGSFEPFDQAEFAGCGADRYLKKPFESEELERLVDELLALDASALATTDSAADTATDLAKEASGEEQSADSTDAFGLGVPAAEADERVEIAPELPMAVAPDAFSPTFDSPDALHFADEAAQAAEQDEAKPPAAGTDFRIGLDDEDDEDDEDDDDTVETDSVEFDVIGDSSEDGQSAEDDAASVEAALQSAPALEQASEPVPEARAESSEAAAPAGSLSEEDLERLARRVADLVGEQMVREVAWEVIPDLAEVIIKDRLRELESQIE